jgi:hypothetical protein
MGYSNKEETYWSAVSLAANLNGDVIETRNVQTGCLQLVWAGASAADAVIKLQESVDGATWFDIATMTQTINAASGSKLFKLTLDILLAANIRAVLTKNSETTGTATLKFNLRGAR